MPRLDGAAMRVDARWMGMHIPIDFRLGRYGSHIREHTIQVDKTLAMIGRQPTEVERVVRLILASYGRLEALFVGRTAGRAGTTARRRLDAPLDPGGGGQRFGRDGRQRPAEV